MREAEKADEGEYILDDHSMVKESITRSWKKTEGAHTMLSRPQPPPMECDVNLHSDSDKE